MNELQRQAFEEVIEAAGDFADLIEADQESNCDKDEDSLADVVKIRAAIEALDGYQVPRFAVETLVGMNADRSNDEDWENLVREDGTVLVECKLYDTLTEANAELEDHFENLQNAAMDYDRSEYRIKEVTQ